MCQSIVINVVISTGGVGPRELHEVMSRVLEALGHANAVEKCDNEGVANVLSLLIVRKDHIPT